MRLGRFQMLWRDEQHDSGNLARVVSDKRLRRLSVDIHVQIDHQSQVHGGDGTAQIAAQFNGVDAHHTGGIAGENDLCGMLGAAQLKLMMKPDLIRVAFRTSAGKDIQAVQNSRDYQ